MVRRYVTVPVPAKDTVLGELTSRHVAARIFVRLRRTGPRGFLVQIEGHDLPPQAAREAEVRLGVLCMNPSSEYTDAWRFEADVPGFAMTDRALHLLDALLGDAEDAWLDIEHGIANVCCTGVSLEDVQARLRVIGAEWMPYEDEGDGLEAPFLRA